ncbi:MAG: CHASE2 domain-containing protein [Cyclobacteriaceae bacterium]|nr:CHASE2 domain-containing protein [Cyclobacteriaceae bacterium]
MRKFFIDCLLATAFVFVTLGGIVQITDLKVFSAFDPLGQALGDMELTDIAFSQLRSDPAIDTNIVIVNIGALPRGGVAEQIRILNKYNPKVIGMDSFFDCPLGLRDTINCPPLADVMGNAMLGNAIAETKNFVLVTRVTQTDSLFNAQLTTDEEISFDSLERTDADIRGNAFEGYANLPTDADNQESFKTCRTFIPRLPVADDTLNAFSIEVARIYAPEKTERFLARGNEEEVINYRGNIVDFYGASSFSGRYFALDWYQVLNEEFLPTLITDKIVMMGYMGDDFSDTSWDDKFFTPLNRQYAGKANPDMYGLVVHANIVSMILAEDYIEVMAKWQEWTIAILVCFLNVALFWLIHHRIPDWFDGITVMLQLLQIILLSFLMIYFFNWYGFKLNLTITLAALALVGTCFEIYVGVVVKTFEVVRNSRWFTKRRAEVLTSD